jgi:hypothetical protein
MASETIALKGKEDKEGPDEWEINNWADSIIRAEEIKLDQKKMKLVNPILAKKKEVLDKIPMSIEKIKSIAADMPLDDNDGDE